MGCDKSDLFEQLIHSGQEKKKITSGGKMRLGQLIKKPNDRWKLKWLGVGQLAFIWKIDTLRSRKGKNLIRIDERQTIQSADALEAEKQAELRMWNANGRSWRLISVSQHRREHKYPGESLVNGVKNAANSVKNAAGSVINKAKSAVSWKFTLHNDRTERVYVWVTVPPRLWQSHVPVSSPSLGPIASHRVFSSLLFFRSPCLAYTSCICTYFFC